MLAVLAVATPLRGDLEDSNAVVTEIAGPSGAYSVSVPKPCRITHGDTFVLIDWGAKPTPLPIPDPRPAPDPIPTPVPDPTPPPAPNPVATGRLYATLITDREVTNEVSVFRGAASLAKPRFTALNAVWHSYVLGQQELTTLNLVKHIPASGVPVVIIQELKPGAKSAAVLKTLTPTTVDALIAELAALRGK